MTMMLTISTTTQILRTLRHALRTMQEVPCTYYSYCCPAPARVVVRLLLPHSELDARVEYGHDNI